MSPHVRLHFVRQIDDIRIDTPNASSAIWRTRRAVSSSQMSTLPVPESSAAASASALLSPPDANTTVGTLFRVSNDGAMARRLIGSSMGLPFRSINCATTSPQAPAAISSSNETSLGKSCHQPRRQEWQATAILVTFPEALFQKRKATTPFRAAPTSPSRASHFPTFRLRLSS